MSLIFLNTKHFGGLKDYRASEGREVPFPHRGDVANTVQTILGGVRLKHVHMLVLQLKQLSKCATFVRVNKPI